jgi:hypothetical protein
MVNRCCADGFWPGQGWGCGGWYVDEMKEKVPGAKARLGWALYCRD